MHAIEPPRPLRLWPGFLILALQWAATFGSGLVAPGTMIHGLGMMLGPIVGLLLLILWWALLSRAEPADRMLGALLPIGVLVVTALLAHRTIVPGGLVIYTIPLLSLVFVLTVALTRSWPETRRRLALVLALGLVGLGFLLVRSTGVDGYFQADFVWRWQPSPEEKLLEAQTDIAALAPPSTVQEPASASETEALEADSEAGAADADTDALALDGDTVGVEAVDGDAVGVEAVDGDAPEGADAVMADAGAGTDAASSSPWPGFRGEDRDSVVRGLRIGTDWQRSPPEELWRRPIGPGWGSFVVAGEKIYTQEQRGEFEIVAAYDAASGEPVWMHRDPARFWEALAGAGPRATPQLAGDRLYSFGATGILNALDAESGATIWSRDVAADTGADLPEWGFASSPLLVNGLAVVYTGAEEKTVAAYDAATGEPRWFAPSGRQGYSSVHAATLHGVEQLLVLTDEGVTSHAPGGGAVLWSHEWKAPGARCVQPAFAADGDPLIGTGFGVGLRRLDLERSGEAWTAKEAWTSNALKPYFNDFVVHDGHAYGFDGRILAAIDLETGERAWKGGRYGHGQLVLLADQDLLLVLSEKGELALVAADPSGHRELARLPAIEGKTWNHPTVAEGVVYVRNGEEMAAFRLPAAEPRQAAAPGL